MINSSCKWLKTFLALEVKKLNFFVTLIFGIRIDFLDLLFLNKFITVSLALLSLLLTTLFALARNGFEANSDDLVVFNRKVSKAAILLKPWIKRQ